MHFHVEAPRNDKERRAGVTRALEREEITISVEDEKAKDRRWHNSPSKSSRWL